MFNGIANESTTSVIARVNALKNGDMLRARIVRTALCSVDRIIFRTTKNIIKVYEYVTTYDDAGNELRGVSTAAREYGSKINANDDDLPLFAAEVYGFEDLFLKAAIS